jgi:hypothetical protein
MFLSTGCWREIRVRAQFWYHEYVVKRRIVKHGVEFVRHVVPKVIRPLHSLWNEVIGFLFLSLAFIGAMSGYRIYRHYDGSPETFFRLILVACFVLIMSYYGISSFLRARKISRS